MDPLTAGLIGGGLGAIGSIAGASIQGIFNSGQAQEQRDYETQMADTTYQRGEADLKAAGLNPILAAGGAVDPTPSVSAATISAPDIGGAIAQGFSTGVSSATAEQNYDQASKTNPVTLQTLQQNLKNAELNGQLTQAQTSQIGANINLINANTSLTSAQKLVALQTVANLVKQGAGIQLSNSAAYQKVVASDLDTEVQHDILNNPFLSPVAHLIRGTESVLLGPILQVPANLLSH